MERFDGDHGMAAVCVVTSALLIGLIALVLVLAYPQFPDFTPAAAAAGIFLLGGLAAAALFLLHAARDFAANILVDDERITRLAWEWSTSIAWRDLVRVEETYTTSPKQPGGVAPGGCILRDAAGRCIRIRFQFVENGLRLRDRLEPYLVPLRAAEVDRLARDGGQFRPGRTIGFAVLTCIAPMFLVGGWSAFDLDIAGRGAPAGNLVYVGYVALVASTLLVLLSVELISQELRVTTDGLRLRSLFRDRTIPFDRVASIAVNVTENEGHISERATIRGDDGQEIAIESMLPGYRAIVELVRSRVGSKVCNGPADDPEFT